MREQVEGLEAGWVGEVGCVGVGWEGEVGVGCVSHGEVGGEVVEAAVVGYADEGDALEEGFGGIGGGVRGVFDEDEAIFFLRGVRGVCLLE